MSEPAQMQASITLDRIRQVHDTHCARYAAARPRSRELDRRLKAGFHDGAPMHWMRDWPMPFLMGIAQAQGATITDIDGNNLADFCLGDTGAMFGHAPAAVVRAVAEQAARGLTVMLPTPDAADVGGMLVERFRLPHWQIATTASDANRFALRVARAATGRDRILVFNGCYHGAVDETFVKLKDGRTVHKAGLVGQAADLTRHSVAVEFNDVDALAAALADRDIACVIAEPVMTNSAMVLPEPGFHDALRRLTRDAGTLLLIDETHTISSGPAGYSGRHGLEPDMLVLGKPIAGGVPASIWGFTDEVARRYEEARSRLEPGYSGIGTTLSANALALAAMRATLSEVMTPCHYAHMEALAETLRDGLGATITRHALPWHVAHVGARVEIVFAPQPLRNGSEAAAAHFDELASALHLGLVNHGILIAPFHNMMLVCPATTGEDVDRLVAGFASIVAELAGAAMR